MIQDEKVSPLTKIRSEEIRKSLAGFKKPIAEQRIDQDPRKVPVKTWR
jgi:hypothetical protein